MTTRRNVYAHLVAISPLIAVLMAASFSLAQNSSAPTVQPIVHVNVDEVSVDMVVRDKKNKPVLDLKPEDIALTDGGSPVQLKDLHLAGADADHLLTFVFDRLDSASARNAQTTAGKILNAVPRGGFLFSVLKVDGRLRLYQDFTSDRAALSLSIQQATAVGKVAQANGWEAPEKRLISIATAGADESGVKVPAKDRSNSQAMLAALHESQKVLEEQHTQPSLSGLLALARTLRKLPGRKTVIFFAQGVQPDSNAEEMIHSIIGAANRGGVSIYCVDSSILNEQVSDGLMASSAMGNAMANRSMISTPALTALPTNPDLATAGMRSQVSAQMQRFENGDPNSGGGPLGELGFSTGGSYIYSGQNLNKPLSRMIEDMTTYYEATYVPPIESYDGQFRAIAIKPVHAGLKVQARTGYFALPLETGSAMRPFEAPLMKVLSQPQWPSDLKFQSRVLRLGDLPSGNENAVVVEVPVTELDTRDDPNSNMYSLHLSLVAQIKDKTGAVLEHFSEDVPRHGSLDTKGSLGAEFITMQRHFTAGPGEYEMEAAIIDQNSGKASAQRIAFEVPKTAGSLSVSDLTLVQRVDPVPQEADPAEPLRYGSGRVIPDLSSRIAHGTKTLSFFFVVHPDPHSDEQPRLEMEVLRSKETIAQMPLQLRKTSGVAAFPYMASIQSAALPGGEYEVIERLTQGGKTSERSLAFTIEGPELAGSVAPDGALNSPSNSGSENLTASDIHLPESSLGGNRSLIITTLPAGSVPAPTADALETIIEGARKHALNYGKSLPNFLCVEVTNRSIDLTGTGSWKSRDSIAELLRYEDDKETRSTLEVNGHRSSMTREELNSSWPMSVGEFGGLLNLTFQPTSKASFEWKEAGTLRDENGTLQVLSYRVARDNAAISLSDGKDRIGAGFHGLVYVDPATGGVRRITLDADDLPKSFSIRAAAMTVDYGFVAIGDRDYLVPVRASVSLRRGKKSVELNEISFRNYRRFASRAKVLIR